MSWIFNPFSCEMDLRVLIETRGQVYWSFLYDIVDENQISLSVSPNKYEIPYGTEVTDHIMREMDELTITGVASCYRCGGGLYIPNYNLVVQKLKELKERMIYCEDDYITIYSNDWIFSNAILVSADIVESQSNRQAKMITTKWLGTNLVGSVTHPEFKRGGIVSLGELPNYILPLVNP